MAKDDTTRNADFVGRVVGDAKNPPETRLLTGWLGDAADEGYRRLYTDAELGAYADIPADAILYTEPIRDVQPSGGVFVWIKRDAAVKYGGSASGRAARFLQGQVQQDFASGGGAAAGRGGGGGGGQDAGSLEKAGFRCATQVPCGEPTGFTGQCTELPEVGGAWPCITAIPHCAEPTGFTGHCTHQPWPNPTRYIGCTFFHCPTQDLTHIPHICNIVATGVPGCPVVDPRGGAIDPAAKVGVAQEGNAAGRLAAEVPAAPVTSIPGCGYTKTWGVCETHLLGCGFTQQPGQQCPTRFPGCGETRDCPTTMPGCGWSKNPICTDLPGCGFTQHWGVCQPTQPPKCNVSVDIPCVTRTETPQCLGIGGGFAAFGAAAPARFGGIVNTQSVQCSLSAIDGCPTRIGCDTKLPTVFCTQLPEACPVDTQFCPPTTVPKLCPDTSCGPRCQTQQPHCTHVACTQAGPLCATQAGAVCPTIPAGCHGTNVQLDCTFHCTQFGICQTFAQECIPNVAAGRAQAFGAAAPIHPTIWTQLGPNCPPSHLIGCTQSGPQCPTFPDGDCTFFGCPTIGARAGAAGPGAGCTQSGPQCPTQAQVHCTLVGQGCPPTPATVCTQFAPCATHQPPCTQIGPQCPTRQFECTMFCTHGGPGCPPVTQTFNCAGGPSAVDACPTRICGGGQQFYSFGHCPSNFRCPRVTFVQECSFPD